jgi:mRNA interferase RelE/StbE
MALKYSSTGFWSEDGTSLSSAKKDLSFCVNSRNKSLVDLPESVQQRIKKAIISLSREPRPSGVKKLAGRLEGSWRIRVGDWRIIYDINDKSHAIVLLDIGPRKSIYR